MAKKTTPASNERARIEYVSLAQIKKWPRNPKRHSMDALGASIGRFGFVMPLLRDEKSGRLAVGHGRLDKLAEMKEAGQLPPTRVAVGKAGEWLVPVICGVSFKNAHEAEAYVLADNRVAELGGYDKSMLAVILKEMSEGADAATVFAGTGWDADDMAFLLARTDPAHVKFKEFDERVEFDVKVVECPKCHARFPLPKPEKKTPKPNSRA